MGEFPTAARGLSRRFLRKGDSGHGSGDGGASRRRWGVRKVPVPFVFHRGWSATKVEKLTTMENEVGGALHQHTIYLWRIKGPTGLA
jgi:hypothetical protein